MKVAIVILNWNGAAMMQRYLPALLRSLSPSDDARVIVGDNASTDNSVQMLNDMFPSVTVIRNDNNYGFAEGYNRVLRQVEAQYYVLLNSDVEVTTGWLQPLVDFMDNHADVAACQPKMLAMTDPGAFEYAGAAGGYIDRYGYPFCRGRLMATLERDKGQYDSPAQVLWASGACLLIRSADYWLAGGLDARFFAHCEEIDLCWRLSLMGRKIYCLPQSSVKHLGGGTLPKNSPHKTYLNFRNNLFMLYKNLPDGELRHVMRVRRVLDFIAALQSLVTGNFIADFVAIRRARRDFYRRRHDFDADRSETARHRITPFAPGHMRYSMLRHYYVLGHKRFSQLPAPDANRQL